MRDRIRNLARFLMAWVPAFAWSWFALTSEDRAAAIVLPYTMPWGGVWLSYFVVAVLYLVPLVLILEAGSAVSLWLWPKYKLKR